MRRNASALLAILGLAGALIVTGDCYGRMCRVELIPNGGKFSCDNCHVAPGGARNLFGLDVQAMVEPGSCDPFWDVELADLDSDSDGLSNGYELRDPEGTWAVGADRPGGLALVSNPGVADERTSIDVVQLAGGLTSPVSGTHAGDGTGRIFIVEQTGRIRIIQGGQLLQTPFLDITDRVIALSSSYDERGLLGLAFHPQYASNGRFFVYYSAPGGAMNHVSRLSEFRVSASDPNAADPTYEQTLMEIDQPEGNHNGGCLVFGPDGMLYIGLGDGGGAGDVHGVIGNGQDTTTLLGSMLRIDVSTPGQYSVPADNPFVGQVEALDEIWAYGLRNPWKFSFDRGGERRLFCGDVGQNLWEEIDIIQGGGNYGWRVIEGTRCYDPPEDCDHTGKILPIADYSHNTGVSVTGGYVYRGSQYPELYGKYVFGDYSAPGFGGNGKLFYLEELSANNWQMFEFITNGGPGSGFGPYVTALVEDEGGELYILTNDFTSPLSESGAIHSITVGGAAETPIPNIRANDSDLPIFVSTAQLVRITIELEPRGYTGANADWWLAVSTPFAAPADWYSYVYPTGWAPGINRLIVFPLFDLSPFEVLNTALPAGAYTFYFAVDDDADGVADATWFDFVPVTVQ